MANSKNLIDDVKSVIREVPDFPKKGILFKDLTTFFKSNLIFNKTIDYLHDYYKSKGITKVAGIESRGFILGSALASKLNAGFIPIRKPGKLPCPTYKQQYALEYGFDEIEVHQDAFLPNDVVLLHDDLLATGGTSAAAVKLIELFKVKDIYVNFICELNYLKGRDKINDKYEMFSLIRYD